MIDYFDNESTRSKRALQIWIVLVACAYNRQTLTYTDLADRIGYQDVRPVIPVLNYIWQYCSQHDLPPLTGLVVNKNTGLPGEGMGDYTLADQEIVFNYNWYSVVPPSPEAFEQSYENKP